MTEEGSLPEFAIAMRGYDRLQVDDYIVKQAVWLNEAEVRVEGAETELASLKGERDSLGAQVAALQEEAFKAAPPSFDELGERVGRVLQEAWAAAGEMRQDAEKAAAEIASRTHEEAAGEVSAMVEDAKRESADLVTRSRAEADRLTGEAERRRRELRAEIALLTDQRDSAMAELARLREGLEALFSVPSPEEETPGATIDLRSLDLGTGVDATVTALMGSPEEAARAEPG
jgi:cell division septum initiation protein DivIVA